ncbi:MAG: hypothetical protein ACREMA_10475 [Longimicrobiales bacterium]
MSLPFARSALNKALDRDDFSEWVQKEWRAAQKLIWTWWLAYKDWEKADTFGKAFYEDRMSMRTWSSDVTKSHTLRLAGNRIWDGKGTDGSKGKHASKGDKLMEEFDAENFKFNVGLESLALRTDPANFFSETGSKKYELGLHDMSCSLLDHRRPISEQSHMKDNGTIFSFVPLSERDDQVIFHKLNQAAKLLNKAHMDFYDLVREFRSKMTRIKLAAEHDMGTGFTAVRRENGPKFKLTYGLGYYTKVVLENKSDRTKPFGGKLGGGKLNMGEVVTDRMRQARREQALNYKSILDRQLFAKNEITVSIRQHEGMFPIFAKFDEPGGRFLAFKIDDKKQLVETKRYIKDNMPRKP